MLRGLPGGRTLHRLYSVLAFPPQQGSGRWRAQSSRGGPGPQAGGRGEGSLVLLLLNGVPVNGVEYTLTGTLRKMPVLL